MGKKLLYNREADDEILIRRFTETGDRIAFTILIERHIQGIRRLLYSLFRGNREDIEDAEQEILLSLLLNLKNFKFMSSFKTYFYRLARNRAIDFLRKKKRQEKEKIIELFRKPPEEPENIVLKEEAKEMIMDALFSLNIEDRTLVHLKDLEGHSIQEISTLLRIPQGTVKSRLHRSREKMAYYLKGLNSYEKQH